MNFVKCLFVLIYKQIQWNPVNTDTKGTGQIVRINGVSVLSGVSEKKVTDIRFLDAKTKANVFTATKRCLIILQLYQIKTVNSLTTINSFYENLRSSHTVELNFNKLNSVATLLYTRNKTHFNSNRTLSIKFPL